MKHAILLCDLDAFFAAVEQLDNPKFKGKPVIIGGDPNSRGVVSTCSYEARRYGVGSAMPMKKALKLCPEAIILPVNMSRYKAVSEQVMDIFERFTPDIKQVSIDEAYLAIKEGTGLDVAWKIRSAVRKELNLPLSIGVSVNILLSKIACSLVKPDNVKAIWPDEIEKILWSLPVNVLPGVGPVTKRELNKFGIKTVNDLAVFSLNALENIIGNDAANLKEYAFGRDSRKLVLKRQRKSLSEEIMFSRIKGDFPKKLLPDGTQEGSWLKVSWRLPKKVKMKEETINALIRLGFTKEEIKSPKALFKIKTAKLYPFVYLAARTGMRRSELLALKWTNIDFNQMIIKVSSSLHHGTKEEGDKMFTKEEMENACKKANFILDAIGG